MYLIRNILIPVGAPRQVLEAAAKRTGIPVDAIDHWQVIRKSIDARKKNRVCFNYSVRISTTSQVKTDHDIQPWRPVEKPPLPANVCSSDHPFIIGCGPAGLFAALALVQQGFQPWLFDRGEPIEVRTKKVQDFWQTGTLDEESNVQFGEGGAGAFSDGKLTARSRDFFAEKVYNHLVEFGADPAILYEALPHLGTDGLQSIVSSLRDYLIHAGCAFHWNAHLRHIRIEAGKITQVQINHDLYHPESVILAIGNSARDTFQMLATEIEMEAKPFAVGVRIEHPQNFIDRSMYGSSTDLAITGPATYRLTSRTSQGSVYSFCMCPGGKVIAGSSEKNTVVTNGMSYLARGGKWANSAIVTAIGPKEFGPGLFSGMQLQQKIERAAFSPDHPYAAPIQKAGDFMKHTAGNVPKGATYRPKVYARDIHEILPTTVNSALEQGLSYFDKRIPGFISQGHIIAPETRTSSPVRILRNRETFHSLTATNLIPIGEGAGYAGGIISSAADGYKIGSSFCKPTPNQLPASMLQNH